MKAICIFLIASSGFFYGVSIDVLTNWSLWGEQGLAIDQYLGYHFREFLCDNSYGYYRNYHEGIDKVIVMNPFFDPPERLMGIPKEKLVLFTWEPHGASPDYCSHFGRIYTYNDDLVDGKKYFKFTYTNLTSMIENRTPFEDKKLCTMIVANWEPKNRVNMVRFFETKPIGEFEFYGQRCFQSYHRLFKGKVSGNVNCGDEKLATLDQYRFCICFENHEINGYVTEKIFSCFAAGCVPIYWGAPNILKYIPENCFIDFRRFQDHEELYSYVKNMSKETYLKYIENIQKFLNSEQGWLFSREHFYEVIRDLMTSTTQGA